MIYATLVAWGMHRSGKGGAKMPDYYEFKKSILNNRERLYKLKDKRIEHLNGNVFKVVQNELEDLCFNVNGICASKTKSKVVSASKTLAHILPNLVPPIDREYTARFFNYNSGNFTPKKEKELFKKVMQTLFSTYQDKFVVFCAQRFIDFHYRNTISLPKLFDYFIVGATTQKNLSKSCAFSTLRDMIICRGMNCWAHKTFIRFNTPFCILKRRNSLMAISPHCRNSPTTASASGRAYMSSRAGSHSRASSSVSRIGRWMFPPKFFRPQPGCNSSTTAWATPYRRRAMARLYTPSSSSCCRSSRRGCRAWWGNGDGTPTGFCGTSWGTAPGYRH